MAVTPIRSDLILIQPLGQPARREGHNDRESQHQHPGCQRLKDSPFSCLRCDLLCVAEEDARRTITRLHDR